MPSKPPRRQPQYHDFDSHRPTFEPSEEAQAPAGPDGEIVSFAVRQVRNGVLLKLATKTKTFGPFRLTPIAASEMVRELSPMPQHR